MTTSNRITIAQMALETIRRHAAEAYPEECCGILVGRFDDQRSATRAVPADNVRQEHRERRYTIDADTLFRVTKGAAQEGLDVVGFYHSHPDHPAEPSQTDLEEATFPQYAYLILSVREGVPHELTAWQLADDRSRFLPVELTPDSRSIPTETGTSR